MIPQLALAWLTELEIFYAGHNYITQFPSFVNSSALAKLNMRNNKLTITPRENIEGLTQLRIFEMQIIFCHVWQIYLIWHRWSNIIPVSTWSQNCQKRYFRDFRNSSNCHVNTIRLLYFQTLLLFCRVCGNSLCKATVCWHSRRLCTFFPTHIPCTRLLISMQ